MNTNKTLKKGHTYGALLGTTQMQMAMLLEVTMGQWSMFESGKRALPAAAMQKLAEMTAYVESPAADARKNLPDILAQEHEKAIKKLEDLLEENTVLLTKAISKRTAAQQKYEGNLNALQLPQFLTSNGKKTKEMTLSALGSIERNATKSLKNNGLDKLMALRAQEHMLKVQRDWLEQNLKALKH